MYEIPPLAVCRPWGAVYNARFRARRTNQVLVSGPRTEASFSNSSAAVQEGQRSKHAAARLGPEHASHKTFHLLSGVHRILGQGDYRLPFYRCNGQKGAPPHGRYLYFHDAATADVVYAILSCSLFYAYFVVYGDCFHLSETLVSAFPVPACALSDKQLAALGSALTADVTKNAEIKQINTKAGENISYAEFFGWKSKNLIDQIDARLANLYGLCLEELDFAQSFDAKFRLSQNYESEEE